MFLIFLISSVILIATRIVYLIFSTFNNSENNVKLNSAKTLIVLGSGGHTTEMLEIVKRLNPKNYNPQYFIVAEGDDNSANKLKLLENKSEHQIFHITRSRKVKQSYVTSIFTTLKSILNCIPLLLKLQPDIIVCNGPGSCIPPCYVAFLYKIFFINRHCKIIFIESYCRVKTLSLSGIILLWLADIFVVQWPELQKYSSKILYFGRLT